jgi:hypothetical protein
LFAFDVTTGGNVMTEGYRTMAANLENEGAPKSVLKDAAAEDVLSALEFGMTFSRGKNRSRPAHEIAIRTVAQMIYAHLTEAGYVIMKKPPSPPHSTHGFKKYLTE